MAIWISPSGESEPYARHQKGYGKNQNAFGCFQAGLRQEEVVRRPREGTVTKIWGKEKYK